MTAVALLDQQGEGIRSYACEEERFIDRAREAAEEYAGKLPDFVCEQTTVRWWRRGDEMDWRKKDEIKAELVYSGGQEVYRNFRIDGLRVLRGTPSGSGLWSWGEFAAAMSDVFAFRTRTRFWALGEAAAGPAKARLFEFRVEKHNSQWKVRFGTIVTPAYTGKIWFDPDTARVLRMELHTDPLPDTFEAESIAVSVDLDWTYVAGLTLVLPRRAEVKAVLRAPARHVVNEITFLNYRQFTVDSQVFCMESHIRYPELEVKKPALPDDATIARARAAAQDYSAKLPDFACDQQTIRQTSRSRKFNWSVQDWIHAELIYTGGREHYRNVTRSSRPVSVDELQRTGTWSKGEFGSTLKDLFSPETASPSWATPRPAPRPFGSASSKWMRPRPIGSSCTEIRSSGPITVAFGSTLRAASSGRSKRCPPACRPTTPSNGSERRSSTPG